MADNIKYIQWAAKVLRIIMVINILIGFGTMVASVVGGVIVLGAGGFVAGLVTILIQFVGILINAFFIYTAARGLELVADMAYQQLVAWHRSQGQTS